MEYLIVAIAVVIAGWMFRNALKDVFDIVKIAGRFGTYLWRLALRLVGRDRSLTLGTKGRSSSVQQLLDSEKENDLATYDRLVTTATSDTIAEYVQAGVGEIATQSHSTDTRAQILHGAYLVGAARAARGTATADRTDRGALKSYEELNEDARQILERALEQTSEDASQAERSELRVTISQLLLRTHRGSGDRAAADTVFETTLSSAPKRLDVQIDMLGLISERWLGGAGETVNLANRIATLPGSNPGVLPASHIEHWMDLDGEASTAYFDQPQVLTELETAYGRLPKRVAPAPWVASHQQMLALNAFALCFSLAAKKSLARDAFSRIGDGFTSFPWIYLDAEPKKAFLDAKDRSS